MRKQTCYAKKTALSTALLLIFSLFPICWAQTAPNDLELKKACLKSVAQSIDMEIERMQVKLNAAQNGPGDPSNVPVFKKRIEELKTEREKYLKMDPAAYPLPEKKTMIVKNSQPIKKGSLLELIDMSRSGPFYILAGIKNDNYKALKPGRQYTLNAYLVYPRDYFFTSAYVYVAGW